MEKQAAIEIIDRYLAGKASGEEKEQFFDWLEHDGEFLALFEEVLKEQYEGNVFETEPNEKLRQLIQARLQVAIREVDPGVVFDRPRADTRQHGVSGTGPRVLRMWKWVAAAAVLIILATTAIVISKRSEKSPPIAVTPSDVHAPSNTRAVITLADGSKVYLNSANNGTIAQENNVAVVKNANGEIVYAMSPAGGGGLNESPNDKRPGVDYNTLSNPRGSKVISLTFSDGTKVWLNSESSLKYPTAFTGNTREVEITGEAYFEVKHNAKQPFKVHLPNGSIVEDIGTAFNINSYADEADTKTTLVEGSVRIFASSALSASSAVKLKPGEQSTQSISNRVIRVQKEADIDQVLAWKNGMFSFSAADIHTVMRQLQRWYDLDVLYSGTPSEKFHVEMSRNTNLSNVFRILEETGGVHFKIEGRKVIVLK